MFPRLTIDLEKIRANTQAVVKLAGDISIVGVTKACLGAPPVAEAMIAGGAVGLADSRLPNLTKLKVGAGFKPARAPLILLRQPQLDEIHAAIAAADQIVVTETDILNRLASALPGGKNIELLVMVEMGDGRDGVPVDELARFLKSARADGIIIAGLAANVGCSFGASPTTAQLQKLAALKPVAEDILGYRLKTLSGGNSACIPLLLAGEIPAPINQLRLGESLILGHDTVEYQPVPGLVRDAVVLEAEVIEVRQKTIAGKSRCRAVLALGRQDIGPAPMRPLKSGWSLLSRSSDHMVAAVTGSKPKVGSRIAFIPSYFALLAAMTSPYIEKRFIGL